VPNSTGQTLAPPAGAPAAAPAVQPPASTAPAGTPAASPAQPPANAPRTLDILPLAQQRQFLERWTPVREFLTQAFEGDQSLASYTDLADNPESQRRVGTALNLILDGMNEATGGAHVNADAGPIHIGTGGVGDILTNAFGVPLELAKQKTQIAIDAAKKLTPREQEYVNAFFASMATSVGMRSLTRQSATEATVNSIAKEIPRLGSITTPNSAAYKRQLEKMYAEGERGARGIPNLIIGPDKALLDSVPAKLAAIKTKGGNAKGGVSELPKNPDANAYKALPKGAHYLWNGVEHIKQ